MQELVRSSYIKVGSWKCQRS